MADSNQLFKMAIQAVGTEDDLARFDRGYMPEQEAEGFLRRAVFAPKIAARPKRYRTWLKHAGPDCPGAEISRHIVPATLNADKFAVLREIEGLAQAIEAPIPELAGLGKYEVHAVCLEASCTYCSASARTRFARVTWEHAESGVLVSMERGL